MRAFLVSVSVAIGSFALCGCGSSAHAPLNENVGGPAPGQPVVTSVSPGTVVAAGPSFTLTVTGTNFAQGDYVEWNFNALTSTFISSTQMTALVPNTFLYETGQAAIDVQTPTPSSLNYGATIYITSPPPPGYAGFTVSSVPVQANDMVWDASSQQIYLSVASTDPTNPSTITALNPATGQLGASVSAGSGADRLAISSDSSWLYAGIDASGEVQRFVLPNLASDITISLGSDPTTSRPYYAFALAVDSVSANTVAVSYADSSSQASTEAIYDGATPRSATVNGAGGYPEPSGGLAWSSSGFDLFAAGFQDYLYVLSVNSSGVTLAQSDQLNPDPSDGSMDLGRITYSAMTGYLYGDDGQVIDPIAGEVVNQFPVGIGGTDGSASLTLDENLGMAWAIGPGIGATSQQVVIEAFSLQTYALLGSIAIPNVVGSPVKLIRWGSNGLAFLTQGTGGPQQGDGVYLISGAFVTNPAVQSVGTQNP